MEVSHANYLKVEFTVRTGPSDGNNLANLSPAIPTTLNNYEDANRVFEHKEGR